MKNPTLRTFGQSGERLYQLSRLHVCYCTVAIVYN
jgi:hypothetical protein